MPYIYPPLASDATPTGQWSKGGRHLLDSDNGDRILVAPPLHVPTQETINTAFAHWYAHQVIELLVKPGQHRPGIGGASDDTWGACGRERDGWLRVGLAPPGYNRPWGRMGMTTSSLPLTRMTPRRRSEIEPLDPWNLLWDHRPKPSMTLVTFVLDVIQRMTISSTAVVAAVWFLFGLGFHEGDGRSGAALREYLREQKWGDFEAVEKRVATLGLLLAGKHLDDNSFLTKSWSEVTAIPVKQIDRMERTALADYHFSLYIPVSSWADHVNKLFASLIYKHDIDDFDTITIPALDQMVTEARCTEMRSPPSLSPSPDYERRLSIQELPAAADQAISRDWTSFARSFAINDVISPSPRQTSLYDADAQMAMAERNVSALVDDDMDDDMNDEEEFLDYDGAKRWLPSASELRRSASQSSAQSFESFYHVDQWRSAVEPEMPDSDPDYTPCTPQSSWDSRAYYPYNVVQPTPQIDTFATFPCPPIRGCSHYRRTCREDDFLDTGACNTFDLKLGDDAVFLEPGIAVIPPPITAHPASRSTFKQGTPRRQT